MKHLAFILGFYILSIAVTPAVRIMYAKFSSNHCGKACSRNSTSENEKNGCEKQSCSPFSCCLKLLTTITPSYKVSNPFRAEIVIKNNFKLERTFLSLRSFDIWHPPRFI